MDKEFIKKKIFEFLNKNELGVIATISTKEKAPESAVIGFGNNEALEIVFGTSNTSRKYVNLQKNPHVSFVIGWSNEAGTVQYEGEAKELSKSEEQVYVALLIQKNVKSKKYVNLEDERFFLVKPTWIRFYDNAGDQPDIYEINF